LESGIECIHAYIENNAKYKEGMYSQLCIMSSCTKSCHEFYGKVSSSFKQDAKLYSQSTPAQTVAMHYKIHFIICQWACMRCAMSKVFKNNVDCGSVKTTLVIYPCNSI